MKNRWLKQSHFLGVWWGNLHLTAQQSNTFIQMFILAFSGTAAYGVITEKYTLPFWLFTLVVVAALCVLASFVWKLSMPSTFISWNQQWWSHDNPLKKEVEAIRKELAEIRKVLDEKKSS